MEKLAPGVQKPASKTVEDRAKVTINGLCKVVHGPSIAAKMYDLE